MAVITKTQLENAAVDVASLSSVINGAANATVTTRLGTTVKTLAHAITDAALGAPVYPDTTAGLAAAAEGGYFSVPSAVAGESLILYRKSGGAAVEVKRYPSMAGVEKFAPTLKSQIKNGNLANAGAGIPWNLSHGPIGALVHTYLNSIGCAYCIDGSNQAVLLEHYQPLTWPRKYKVGAWLAYSVFILADNFDWVDPYPDPVGRIQVLVWDADYVHQQTIVASTTYEDLGGGLRRYYGKAKLTVDGEIAVFAVVAPASRSAALRVTGFAAACSDGEPGGVDPLDFDPYEARAQDLRLTAIESGESNSYVKTQAVKGNLPGGVAATGSGASNGASIQALVDYYLNARFVSYAFVMADTTKTQESYFKFTPSAARFINGNWLAVSWVVKATDWLWDTERVRVLAYPYGSNQPQVIAPTGHVQIDASTRRYYALAQLAMTHGTDLEYVYVETTAPTGRTATVKATAYAVAGMDDRPANVDPYDFDPFRANDHEARIADIESVIPAFSSENPKLILPTSLHLVEGHPLTVYKTGLSEIRELNRYEIEFVGQSGDGLRPFVGYVGRHLELDGARLSGAGTVWARLGSDANDVYKRAITYYSSPATKVASPKILMIGDSLTYRGTASKMAAKLAAAGLTPTYIGTFKDAGGVWCEGRPSWEFSDFTRKLLVVNPDGSAPTYPIDATGGDGVVTNVAQYLALSSAPGDYAARWQYNPFIRPTVGGDNPAFVQNGYIFDMRFYLDRFAFADPDIVIIALSANDLSSHDPATALAYCVEGLNILYTQTRAALPNAKVGIVLNGYPEKALWDTAVPYFKHVLGTYGGREEEGVYVLPVYMVMDTKTAYGIAVASTDALGTQQGITSDWVHADAIGMSQWAEMTFAFVMNQI